MILKSIQSEINDRLKYAIDDVEKIMNMFLQSIAFYKTNKNDPTRLPFLKKQDTPLLEKAFDEVYVKVANSNARITDGMIAKYDWIESWVLSEWADLIDKNDAVDLEDFRDNLKQIILNAYRNLDDNYQKLKLVLNNSKCDWECNKQLKTDLEKLISDSTDVPHIALAASYMISLQSSSKFRNAIYVTNDFELLKSKYDVENLCKLVLVRPGFAYPYFKMNNFNN